MSRLVVVSNRVAVPGISSAGGLAVALQAALEETGGMLASSATVSTTITAYTPATPTTAGSISIEVAVTNLSGHKLPTGYPEGRRMRSSPPTSSAPTAVARAT